MIYGYCRISTPRQNLERQVRNIRNNYPDAVIVREIYTGTKVQGRKEFTKLLKKVAKGDTLVFDSVSRMSRTAQEGYGIYEELYNQGVSLVFLKEPHINTSTYQQAIDSQLSMKINTGDLASDELMAGIVNAVNGYILNLARKQILLAFEQSEKEWQICIKEPGKELKQHVLMENRSDFRQEPSWLRKNLWKRNG